MNCVLSKNHYEDLTELAQEVFEKLNGKIVMGVPIGIGKATDLINAFYQLAKKNPDYTLEIHSALSLGRPKLKTELERRLLEPFFDRQFDGVPVIDFAEEALNGELPKNVSVVEFYFKPGEMLRNKKAQQNALSTNYTHVPRDLLLRNVNLILQMIAVKHEGGKTRYSLASNPDVTLDVQRLMKEAERKDGKPRLLIAQVNSEMPFMPNDAEVDASFFDHIHDDPKLYSPLFAAPYQPISPIDHMIGFYSSLLIKDNGSLQIGIGSLGDAVVNSLLVRHNNNELYRRLVDKSSAIEKFPVIKTEGGMDTFQTGLYGNTEMLVPGYLALKSGGILKRCVYDDITLQALVNEGLNPNTISLDWIDGLIDKERISCQLTSKNLAYLKNWGLVKPTLKLEGKQLTIGDNATVNDLSLDETRLWLKNYALGDALQHPTLLHAGFFVGGKQFYDSLRTMPESELNKFNMTSVMFTNQLQGNEQLKLKQMHSARFVNACMKMTLGGGAVSDGLANGKVVSGVGGQFNFVTMGHDLPDARSILVMRSCRHKGTKVISNIVFNYGHITVPRHMRDIVITEYGIADLRAKNDQEIIAELIQIADSRFQKDLIEQAQKAGKLTKTYKLPESAQNNTPVSIEHFLGDLKTTTFKPFPFGCDLTDQEVAIGTALKKLKRLADQKWPLIPVLFSSTSPQKVESAKADLQRLGLYNAKGIKQKILRKLVLACLN